VVVHHFQDAGQSRPIGLEVVNMEVRIVVQALACILRRRFFAYERNTHD
jgi:hypothetical protein